MARAYFDHKIGPQGALLRLIEKSWAGRSQIVPVDDWATRMADQAFTGISRLLALLDDVDSSVERRDDGILVDHATVASLTEPQALGLGLPPSVRVALQVETQNLITDKNFRVIGRWMGMGNRALRANREGAFLLVDGQMCRLPEPLFGLVEAMDAFAATDTAENDVRMARLADLQSLIGQATHQQVSLDTYFSSLRILHAAAFSLSLKTAGGSFDFDPVFFGRRVVEHAKDGNTPISEAEGLLTEHQQEVFATQRFRASDSVKPSYVIESGVYVHLDPSLRIAMAVVRDAQRGDAETRRRFAQQPHLYLKEAISETLSDGDIEHLFVETEQYSARVVDIGVWVPPVLPWIKKEPNDWLPEKFGLQIGGEYIALKPEELAPLRDKIKEAMVRGDPFVAVGNTQIPATPEAEQALINLIGMVGPIPGEQKRADSDKKVQEERADEKHVLIVEENFNTLGFKRAITPRVNAEPTLPTAIRSSLKKHQHSGLAWLQDTWVRGYPGVLLADDMGLGKTLQALAFLAWLREIATKGPQFAPVKGPILIVAPTGLLANWEREHNVHVHAPGLGDICRAYGRYLQPLKITSSRDIDRGAPALDHRRIQQANWVLTTYETLRDYHISFAAIRFSCAVFDEMQKVKSPTSLLTRAAKTVHANFVLGLTGTPIENQLSDFWCIMDIINPGRLSDLKNFSSIYQPDDEKALEALHDQMLTANAEGPAPMLRRMKTDELDGLPEKKLHIRRRPMPESQAQIYAKVVAQSKQPESGPMLETLHMLRGVSLHPIWPPAGEIKDEQSFIDQSARLSETFVILDEIAVKREKALIFLESLDLQEHLALMIKRRYGLKRRPMQINGEVAGEKRQKLVDEFQATGGAFDVMILSPRAGGVGLTLTAANHVIHLSRWWNPAVEDQCTDRVYRIGQGRTVHVYYPMAVHPAYGGSTFDELLHALLTRKRKLSERMLLPPVNLTKDQNWFAENLGRKAAEDAVEKANIEEIDVMEPIAFERWALSRCVALGWEVSRTPRSYDGGADGILVHRVTNARVILQCKHKQSTDTTCGPEAVDDLLRARASYGQGGRLFVLTNAERFSRITCERAQKHGVLLIGRADLPLWPRQLLS
jgi:hypothetical protein